MVSATSTWGGFFVGESMKWFKHYNNAKDSNSLTEIKAIYGHQGIGRYWELLEAMCLKFDGEEDEIFVFSTKELRNLMGFHRTQDMVKYLSSLEQVGIMSHTSKDHVIEIRSDILVRLQGRDYKKARSKRDEPAPKKETKTKTKKENRAAAEKVENVLDSKPNKIAAFYNLVAKELKLTKVKLPLSTDRVKKVNVALKEFPSGDDWENIIVEIAENPFNLGENDRAWKANFDWLFHTTKFNYRKLWEAYESKNS